MALPRDDEDDSEEESGSSVKSDNPAPQHANSALSLFEVGSDDSQSRYIPSSNRQSWDPNSMPPPTLPASFKDRSLMPPPLLPASFKSPMAKIPIFTKNSDFRTPFKSTERIPIFTEDSDLTAPFNSSMERIPIFSKNSGWSYPNIESTARKIPSITMAPEFTSRASRAGSASLPRTTLPDVLSNTAPLPWTLSAFSAYLSKNDCLAYLEYIRDADRYRERFDRMTVQNAEMDETSISPNAEECDYLRKLWQKILETYFVYDGPQVIGIPGKICHTLFSLPTDKFPPRPEKLDEATKTIYSWLDKALTSFLSGEDFQHPMYIPRRIDTTD